MNSADLRGPKGDSFDDFRNQAQDREPRIGPGSKSFVPSPGWAVSTASTPLMHSLRLFRNLESVLPPDNFARIACALLNAPQAVGAAFRGSPEDGLYHSL